MSEDFKNKEICVYLQVVIYSLDFRNESPKMLKRIFLLINNSMHPAQYIVRKLQQYNVCRPIDI